MTSKVGDKVRLRSLKEIKKIKIRKFDSYHLYGIPEEYIEKLAGKVVTIEKLSNAVSSEYRHDDNIYDYVLREESDKSFDWCWPAEWFVGDVGDQLQFVF